MPLLKNPWWEAFALGPAAGLPAYKAGGHPTGKLREGSTNMWLLHAKTPAWDENYLFSTRERADAGKQKLMRLWMDAQRIGGDEESLNTPAAREYPEYITDPVEQFLYDCDVAFYLMEFEVDEEPMPSD